MPSAIAWIDYSEHQRRQMLDLIDKFREQGTRDELGIGAVRDAFADALFPGTSTIQTRAKYFLFVPWIYSALERSKVESNEIAQRSKRDELRLINALAASPDSEGTIGIRARESVKRLASSVYWAGLGIWRIRLFEGPQEVYYRSLNRQYVRRQEKTKDDDGNPLSGAPKATWHTGLPPAPGDFPNTASFALSRAESAYLQERVQFAAQGTLLAWLVGNGDVAAQSDFPWMHPQAAQFPPSIRPLLGHARRFSETMLGAALLYNLMLSEASGRKALVDNYRDRISKWVSEFVDEEWDLQEFWRVVRRSNPRVGFPTEQFINRWLQLARATSVRASLATNTEARSLLEDREKHLKQTLARLQNPHALEMWRGASGTDQLDYRWPVVQTITQDILTGLKGIPNA